VRRVGVPRRLDRRRRHGWLVGLAADELATEVDQLPDQARTVPVHDVGLLLHGGHDGVQVALDQLARPQGRRRVDDHGAGDDQPDPALRQPLEVLDVAVCRDAVLHEAGPRRQRDEPVPQVEPPEPER
jgi:hypothetical protein